MKKNDFLYFAKKYFDTDINDREFLVDYIFEAIMLQRETELNENEVVYGLSELYEMHLKHWESLEEYHVCQIIVDSAQKYEIDLGLDND